MVRIASNIYFELADQAMLESNVDSKEILVMLKDGTVILSKTLDADIEKFSKVFQQVWNGSYEYDLILTEPDESLAEIYVSISLNILEFI